MKPYGLVSIPFASLLLISASPAQRVMPALVSNQYVLTLGPMTFKAGPRCGGRIASLSMNAVEVLHRDTNNANNWGSTFWPSPQAVWNWPPPANLDGCSNPYSGAVNLAETTAVLSGNTDNGTGLRFRKTFWALRSDSSFNIRYAMINTAASRSWAPWEDTRLPAGGLYLFPTGQNAITGALGNLTRDSLGMTWFRYDSARVPTSGTNKFYRDGARGWFAHIGKNRILFLKKFQDTPLSQKAPNPEDEIELYTDNARNFVEMEQQGRYAPIASGDSAVWDVKWFVRAVPASLNVAVGNQAVVDYINQILSSSTALLSSSRPVPGIAFVPGGFFLEIEAPRELSLAWADIGGRMETVFSGELPRGRSFFAEKTGWHPTGIRWLVARDLRTGKVLFRKPLSPV